MKKAFYHLPGLFEFYELYKIFLPLFFEHREYFYEWCEIGSIYGAPYDCLWGGGRVGYGENDAESVLNLINKYTISARLTFSNSLLNENHLSDKKCNSLCRIFERKFDKQNNTQGNGIIIYSDLLLNYIKENYPDFYFVSTTTKVITDFEKLLEEINNDSYKYVVPDFRLNKSERLFNELNQSQKDKIELLCNEACYFGCNSRKECYESVSKKALSISDDNHVCEAPNAYEGYVFSRAMENPGFIGIDDIQNIYMPNGITNFKIEGRSLGSALVLEFLLYYMTKPECALKVREKIYLNHSLDLF